MEECRNKVSIVHVVLFLIQLAFLFVLCQEILKVKDGNIAGFYDCASNLDIVSVGPSTMFCSIKPDIMESEYGVKAYDFGSSAQTLDITYFYVKEVFKRQKPKLIVVDISRIELPEGISRSEENTARWAFTSIRPSVDLYKELYLWTGGFNKHFLSYVFPILFYHDRYADIHRDDFLRVFGFNSSTCGGYVEKTTVAKDITLCDMSDFGVLEPFGLQQIDIDYLDKIIELCKENDAKVVFYRAPSTDGIWDYNHYMAIEEYAESRNIDLIDMNFLLDEMDFSISDMADQAHCNDIGANKNTRMFCDVLSELGYI